jgi:cell division septal protein FtsQ
VCEIAAAVYTSPWTGLRTVTVVGAQERDQARISRVLRPLAGRPVLSLDTKGLRKSLLSEPRLDAVRVARGLDGRLSISLTYRRPFVTVECGDRAYDADAKAVPFEPVSLRRVFDVRFVGPAQVALGRPMPALRDPIRVLLEVRKLSLAREAKVTVDRDGQMCLNLGGSAPIRLGIGDRIPAKLAALQTILSRDATLLTRAEYLDLKSPESPAWKRRVSAAGQ